MRLDGLVEAPRPQAPRTIMDEDVERVIDTALERTPKEATHCSTKSMAEATGVSRSSISRIERAFSLQPHRVETFRLSNDPVMVANLVESWFAVQTNRRVRRASFRSTRSSTQSNCSACRLLTQSTSVIPSDGVLEYARGDCRAEPWISTVPSRVPKSPEWKSAFENCRHSIAPVAWSTRGVARPSEGLATPGA